MKKTNNLINHIKNTIPKRNIQEGWDGVLSFAEMLKRQKINVIDESILNRLYENEDYVD